MSDQIVSRHVVAHCLRCGGRHLMTEAAFVRNRPCPDCGGILAYRRPAGRSDFSPRKKVNA